MIAISQTHAQKEFNTTASNLNLSKSNVNRLVYQNDIIGSKNAAKLLSDLELFGTTDPTVLKFWLDSNISKYGPKASQINQISVFNFRQYADCTQCQKVCRGRCWDEPGSDCKCINPPSEPNLRTTDSAKAGFIVFLYNQPLSESQALSMTMSSIQNMR